MSGRSKSQRRVALIGERACTNRARLAARSTRPPSIIPVRVPILGRSSGRQSCQCSWSSRGWASPSEEGIAASICVAAERRANSGQERVPGRGMSKNFLGGAHIFVGSALTCVGTRAANEKSLTAFPLPPWARPPSGTAECECAHADGTAAHPLAHLGHRTVSLYRCATSRRMRVSTRSDEMIAFSGET